MSVSIATLCTREELQAAMDAKATARDFPQLDRAIEGAVAAVFGLTHRRFIPWEGTRSVDWPNQQYARAWRLWLGPNEVASVSALVSGGVTIPAADYFLRRSDQIDEAPYSHIEIDLASSSAFSVGDTHQRSVAITGVFIGCPLTDAPAGALAEALDVSETGVDVTDSAAIGVGHLIKVDSERMIVADKSMLDTGVDIDAGDSLTANVADVTITMSTTTGAPVSGEVILIDSERMLVVDVAGTALTVKRAWDGTVLATHAAAASIFAPRSLSVVRAAAGTTAATHDSAAAITKHVVPPLVRDLAIAEALSTLAQEGSAYARVAGSGENQREVEGRGLKGLREDVYTAHGRKARKAAV